MEDTSVSPSILTESARRLGQRLVAIGENRFELFVVELQEERDRLVTMLWLTVGVAALGLLAGMVLTAAVVVAAWAWSPVGVLAGFGGIYAIAAVVLCRRLRALQEQQKSFVASLEQLRKDRAWLEGNGK